ncbi:hypothetical protein AURANDRAFT_67331 [Aureococcus anophagefferens]|uniref:Uncharacterized protein n=1 Tax=Aureococcus anophagefferens TaxID=44056 RepID=F0YKS8_AURAN|nr:hypothetical protein AURANDRAFT_67331 [Aureococcus anophagefferens]EGB04290.1 hypothetical protein AURANDRAFT_67331 [Aureococcus anophagefferens]|eukprot:XP_009041000.1 hypothetical protein AURANDRAFT_67331 [Aureococcus anophagefferens]
MLIIAVADVASATSQSTFGLFVALHQPLGIAPVALRRRVRSQLIRRWVLLQEELEASTALRSGLVEVITSRGIGEILVDKGSCSWRQTAEYIYNFQKEGIHAMILHTDTRTQRARLGPHTEAILPKKSSELPYLVFCRDTARMCSIGCSILTGGRAGLKLMGNYRRNVSGESADLLDRGVVSAFHDLSSSPYSHALTLAHTKPLYDQRPILNCAETRSICRVPFWGKRATWLYTTAAFGWLFTGQFTSVLMTRLRSKETSLTSTVQESVEMWMLALNTLFRICKFNIRAIDAILCSMQPGL